MLSSDYSSQPSVSVSQLPPQAGLVGGGSSGAGGGGSAHPTWGHIEIFISLIQTAVYRSLLTDTVKTKVKGIPLIKWMDI